MRRAFTMLEILIVIVVIGSLMSLFLVGWAQVILSSERLQCSQRILDVTERVFSFRPEIGGSAYCLGRDCMGIDLRWGSVREVYSEIQIKHGVDFSERPELVPHNTALWFDKDLISHSRPGGSEVRSVVDHVGGNNYGLDRAVGFGVPIIVFNSHWDGYITDCSGVYDQNGNLFGSADFGGWDGRHPNPRPSYAFLRENGVVPKSMEGIYYCYPFDYNAKRFKRSRIGEDLDHTLEVMPTSSDWDRERYLKEWPALVDSIDPETGQYQVLNGWPLSNWRDGDPDIWNGGESIPPIWPWPWGLKVMSRERHGALVNKKLEIKLSDMSPLHTIEILQEIGVLPEGEEGARVYRSDRGRDRPWNDPWGNPIVVGAALFLPLRYIADDGEDYRRVKGGRDLFLKNSNDFYGFNRAFYFSVGAVGEHRKDFDDDIDLDGWEAVGEVGEWEPVDDYKILRLLWSQVCSVCDADDWTQDSFSEPLWSGVKVGKGRKVESYLSSPMMVK